MVNLSRGCGKRANPSLPFRKQAIDTANLSVDVAIVGIGWRSPSNSVDIHLDCQPINRFNAKMIL
jgi:hypothetical protein